MPQVLRAAALLGAALAPAALASDGVYRGAVEAIGTASGASRVAGTVFVDQNRNSRLDPGEPGLPGVAVSNGREVVLSDDTGRYALPARDDMTVMITKPAGFASPVNARFIPQFAYTHKPGGTDPLRYGGLPDTGPLPAAINFPVVPDGSGDADFECLFLGDIQTYSNREVGFVRDRLTAHFARRDMANVACILLMGDIAGDDLSLVPRLQDILATARTPLWAVPGNHDLDFDAGTDADSFDTFRRQWGAPYYSFDIGAVHFVVLDNVRYPCNGVDPFEGCGTDDAPTYSGVISDDHLDWLANDLAHVPREKLIVLNQHIPLQSFTNAAQQRGQTANLGALAALLEGRKVVAFSAHTHTVENIAPGESFAGWRKATGIAASPFHRQHIVGAVSGSWFTGNLDDAGIPEAYQRLGAPPGVMEVSFSGTNHAETYVALGTAADARLHAAPNTPRFRDWARAVIAHNNRGAPPFETVPPVALADYADPGLITRADLRGGSWIAVNVWNGGADTLVSFRIGDRPAVDAVRSQEGAGEAVRRGPAFADPFAFVRQASDGRVAAVSETDARGYRAFRGRIFAGYPGAPPNWLLGRSSSHLWFADLPPDLPAGLHRVTITATDRHGREVTGTLTIEVVEAMPPMEWQPDLWD